MRKFYVESSSFLKIKELVVPGLSLEAFLIVPAAAAAAAAAAAVSAAAASTAANKQIQQTNKNITNHNVDCFSYWHECVLRILNL